VQGRAGVLGPRPSWARARGGARVGSSGPHPPSRPRSRATRPPSPASGRRLEVRSPGEAQSARRGPTDLILRSRAASWYGPGTVSGPVVLGSYELLDRIAEGGMAEVWRARARGAAGFEKTVVIKRVLPNLMQKAGFADLLVREAKISARLSHPSIVQIFELGEENGAYFIAMEYVHGKDLGQAMAWRGGSVEGLPLTLRLWIVAEAAKALDHAHRRRGDDGRPLSIVHRDVSPQNILLSYEGDVKVADFGIARADESGLGRGEDPKILRGKYAYMSPEQARGEPLDRRSDLFSLGVVLYELLSGRRMFRGRTSQETLAMVREAKLPDLDPDSVGVAPELSAVLKRALAASKEDRYAWGGELASELTQYLFRQGTPIGQPDLAAAMDRMFPPEDLLSPNKLRVDVMRRAFDDAQAVSQAGAVLAAGEEPSNDGDRTAAVPVSRRMRVEKRALALLVAQERDAEDAIFAQACEVGGGTVFGPLDGMRVGAFGHAVGIERAVAHAARAALELRRLAQEAHYGRPDAVPPCAVLEGEGKVIEGVLVEPEQEVVDRARVLLEGVPAGEIRLEPVVAADLESTFRIVREGALGLGGFRGRADREGPALRRAPLVGRRDEVDDLTGALDRVRGGAMEVLQLVGEAGVGKSRLIGELRALALTRDFAIVSARADESASEGSHHVLAELVADLCGLEPEDAPGVRFGKVDRLRVLNLKPREVRLLGELLGLAYPVANEERAGRPRGVELAVAVRRALSTLARDRPLLLIVEDLHWLDDASRQVLPLILRGLERPRVLVVLTRRAGTNGPAFTGRTRRVAPLGRDASSRLLAHALGAKSVDGALGAFVHAETSGNPLWTELVAADLLAMGAVRVVDGTALAGPQPLVPTTPSMARRLVAARIAQLRQLDRNLVLVTAAFDGPVPAALVASIEGLVSDAGASAFRRLFARTLLAPHVRSASQPGHSIDELVGEPAGAWGGDKPSAVPEEIVVPGTLLRRAALETLDRSDRERLHGKIATAIERSERTERTNAWLAYHAARSNDRRRAPDYLVLAADELERRNEPRGAAERLVEAIGVLLAEALDPSGDRVLALALRAAPLALRGGEDRLADEAIERARRSAGLRSDPASRAALACVEMMVALARQRPDLALSVIERERGAAEGKALEGIVPADRARIAVLEGRALLALGHGKRAVDALALGASLASKGGDTVLEGRAQAHLADALGRLERFEEAEDTLGLALALAARSAHAELRFVSLAAMGAVREGAGDSRGASARYREALEVATAVIPDAEIAEIASRAAVAALRAGLDSEAGQRAQQALDIAKKRRLEIATALASAAQATVAIATFADATYLAHVRRSVERLEAAGARVELALCLELLARAEGAMGDADARRDAITRARAAAAQADWPALARAVARSA
jgi:serine/threonine protein kinase